MCFVHPTDELCFSVTWSTPSSTRCPGMSEQERPAASLQVRALSACQMLPSSHHGNHSPTYSCSLSSTCPSNATGMKYQLHHYLSLQIKWSDVCVCVCVVSLDLVCLCFAEIIWSPASGKELGEVKLSISFKNEKLFIMVMHIRRLVSLSMCLCCRHKHLCD